MLAICGHPGPELTEAIGKVWDQLPGPRAGLGLAGSDIGDEEIDAALKRARDYLADTAVQRSDARERRTPEVAPREPVSHDTDHGDMQMAPSGIPLAEGGQDRDGLEMDVLHVRLGPVLRHWPAGPGRALLTAG